ESAAYKPGALASISEIPGGRPSIANALCTSDSVSLFTGPRRTMRGCGKTAGSPLVRFGNMSPLIDPGAGELTLAKPRARNGRIDNVVPDNRRKAVPPDYLNCNALTKPRAPEAIYFKALIKREMRCVRAQPTVNSEVSFEFVRFDTSKACLVTITQLS